MSSEILTKNESVKYLGQRISFHKQETLEIKSRIRAAWATFHKYRQELTSKNFMLKHLRFLFLRPFATQQEHGHRAKNTKERFNRRKARCYDSIQTKRKYKKIEKQAQRRERNS